MNRNNLAIGIDLGGTKISLGIVDANGNVLKHARIPTEVENGADRIIDKLIEKVKFLENQVGSNQVKAIGLAIAGQVDGITGVVKFAPNLCWNNVPVGKTLSQALKKPVTVINDVRAAALAEWTFGAGKGRKDFICLFVGTGIGGGIVSNGVLVEGHHHSAGEVGHMVISYKGDMCTCGNIGCWETIAGGWGVARRFKNALLKAPEKGGQVLQMAGGNFELITAKHVIEAAAQGDALACEFVDELKEALIVGCSNLVNVLNPECLILGGGIIAGAPWLIEAIEFGVRHRALKSATEYLKIMPAQLTTKAVYVGAAVLACIPKHNA